MNSKAIKKYNLSKYRFRELYYFCQQYEEWKYELEHCKDTVKSVEVTGMPGATKQSDQTSDLAMRRVELEKKIDLVERTAKEAEPELEKYILAAVTNYGVTYTYLREFMGIPCGKNMYYEARNRFYWLLDKKLR